MQPLTDAIAAARALAEVHPTALVDRLEPAAKNKHAASSDRILAVDGGLGGSIFQFF